MEQFEICRENAKTQLKVADHMLVITYPLVKDPKLLFAVVEKLFASLENSMSSLLYFDRLYKRIGPFADNFDSKFTVFKAQIVPKYGISKDFIALLQEVKQIVSEHEKSPVEFRRRDQFVICSDNYRMRSLSVETLKKYVSKAKDFVREMDLLVNKNVGIIK